MTNTTPTGAYRGAGRPEAAYMLERLIDRAAASRTRSGRHATPQFHPAGCVPVPRRRAARSTTAATTPARSTRRWRSSTGHAAGPARRGARRRQIGRVGIGVYCEFAGPGWDSAEVRVAPTGSVTVFTGISPHGQGNETSMAQIVADELGYRRSRVDHRARQRHGGHAAGHRHVRVAWHGHRWRRSGAGGDAKSRQGQAAGGRHA